MVKVRFFAGLVALFLSCLLFSGWELDLAWVSKIHYIQSGIQYAMTLVVTSGFGRKVFLGVSLFILCPFTFMLYCITPYKPDLYWSVWRVCCSIFVPWLTLCSYYWFGCHCHPQFYWNDWWIYGNTLWINWDKYTYHHAETWKTVWCTGTPLL